MELNIKDMTAEQIADAKAQIEAWNTRTEKTCYVLDYRAIPDEGSILCRLSCDHEVLIPDLGPFNPSIEYCPYCAAKVMNNDNRHD